MESKRAENSFGVFEERYKKDFDELKGNIKDICDLVLNDKKKNRELRVVHITMSMTLKMSIIIPFIVNDVKRTYKKMNKSDRINLISSGVMKILDEAFEILNSKIKELEDTELDDLLWATCRSLVQTFLFRLLDNDGVKNSCSCF